MHETLLSADRHGNAPINEKDLELVIGTNLRRLRKQHGLTLESLAQLTGVSRAMLGQIELGHSVPTIKVLWKIAQAIDVPVGTFLSRENGGGTYILAADNAKVLVSAAGGFRTRALFPAERARKVKFYELGLAGFTTEEVQPYPPGTTVNLVVCRGELEMVVDRSIVRLAHGDAIFFDADVAHQYRNPGSTEVMVFMVLNLPKAAD